MICPQCGNELADNMKFCFKCGFQLKQDNAANGERKIEYAGKIEKCPSCGENLPPLVGICPSCGHEIVGVEISKITKDFISGVFRFEDSNSKLTPMRQGWSSWSNGIKAFWVILNGFTLCIPLLIYLVLPVFNITPGVNLTPMEKSEVTFVQNFAFPTDKKVLLESLIFIKSKLEFWSTSKMTSTMAYWSRLWGNKADQVFKSLIMFFGSDEFTQKLYNDINIIKSNIKKKFLNRFIISAVIVGICYTAFFIFIGVSTIDIRKKAAIRAAEVEAQRQADAKKAEEDAKKAAEQAVIDAEKAKEQAAADAAKKAEEEAKKAEQEKEYMASTFEWPTEGVATTIPAPPSNKGVIIDNKKKLLYVYVYGLTEDQFADYNEALRKTDYKYDIEDKSSNQYKAYNIDGDKVSTWMSNNDVSKVTIRIEVAEEYDKIKWPSVGPATMIPKPPSEYGKVVSDTSNYYTIDLFKVTKDEYTDYVQKCIDKGFTNKYTRSDNHFWAHKDNDYTLYIDYEDGNQMHISVFNY